jgi:hypothetical protein
MRPLNDRGWCRCPFDALRHANWANALALAAAREVTQAFASCRPAIEQALFEHGAPYAEAVIALMCRWCLYPSRH